MLQTSLSQECLIFLLIVLLFCSMDLYFTYATKSFQQGTYLAVQPLDITILPLLELALIAFTIKEFLGKSQWCI